MTPPLRPSVSANRPAPDSPEESPEVRSARSAVDQAGYARNIADIQYKHAVSEHGADSAEAKTAKGTLEQAQAKVEETQANLRKVLKLTPTVKLAPTNSAPKPPSNAVPNKNKGPAPKAAPETPNSKDKPKNSESVEKIYEELPPIRGEYTIHRVYERLEFRNDEILEKLKKDPKLKKILDEVLKNSELRKGYFERLQKPQGAYLQMFEVSEARPMAPRPQEPGKAPVKRD